MENLSRPGHIGRKISRLRELRNMKQETLAQELGISQQSVSRLEQSETIEDEVLEKVAKVLGVNSQAVKNFNEDAIISNINSFYDNSNFNFQCTFNPLDRLMEALDENKRLNEENKRLYERLLQSEREKVEILRSK